MRQLFVYYRVAEDRLGTALDSARLMQRRLMAGHPGLRADLLRRPGSQDGQVTLMETYSSPGGVNAALGRDIEAAAAVLSGCIAGARHVEAFEPA
jgi:hypothetical protein